MEPVWRLHATGIKAAHQEPKYRVRFTKGAAHLGVLTHVLACSGDDIVKLFFQVHVSFRTRLAFQFAEPLPALEDRAALRGVLWIREFDPAVTQVPVKGLNDFTGLSECGLNFPLAELYG
jgi:hypothetical protein